MRSPENSTLSIPASKRWRSQRAPSGAIVGMYGLSLSSPSAFRYWRHRPSLQSPQAVGIGDPHGPLLIFRKGPRPLLERRRLIDALESAGRRGPVIAKDAAGRGNPQPAETVDEPAVRSLAREPVVPAEQTDLPGGRIDARHAARLHHRPHGAVGGLSQPAHIVAAQAVFPGPGAGRPAPSSRAKPSDVPTQSAPFLSRRMLQIRSDGRPCARRPGLPFAVTQPAGHASADQGNPQRSLAIFQDGAGHGGAQAAPLVDEAPVGLAMDGQPFVGRDHDRSVPAGTSRRPRRCWMRYPVFPAPAAPRREACDRACWGCGPIRNRPASMPMASQASSGNPSAGPKMATRPPVFDAQPPSAAEPELRTVARDSAHGHAGQFRSQRIGTRGEGAVAGLAAASYKPSGSRQPHMTTRVIGHPLRAGQHAAQPGDWLESPPVETENLRTRIGPNGPIRRHVQRMNFRGARQALGGRHQAEAGPVVAVQSPFRSGPDITGSILRQRQDGQVLKPIGGPVVAEAVLLSETAGGQRQDERRAHAEAKIPAFHTSLIG